MTSTGVGYRVLCRTPPAPLRSLLFDRVWFFKLYNTRSSFSGSTDAESELHSASAAQCHGYRLAEKQTGRGISSPAERR